MQRTGLIVKKSMYLTITFYTHNYLVSIKSHLQIYKYKGFFMYIVIVLHSQYYIHHITAVSIDVDILRTPSLEVLYLNYTLSTPVLQSLPSSTPLCTLDTHFTPSQQSLYTQSTPSLVAPTQDRVLK